MPGLNEFLTDKALTKETMPSWFTGAQESLVKSAQEAKTPAIGQTTAQKAIDVFGAQGPFSSAQSTLQAIGSGAANPWITSTDAAGKTTVRPNVSTPLGGLFGAQQDYLNQILPEIGAAETAKSIAGGGFGSSMNLSALQRARAAAASDLFQKQMSAALQAQQTGVQAGQGLGTLGSQIAKGALETGTFEQGYPYTNLVNLANIFGRLGPYTGKTTEQTKELSLLGQLGGLGTLIGGLPTQLSNIKGGLSGVYDWVKSLGSGSSGSSGGSSYPPVYGTSEGE
jgi:hypothetical protein